MTIIDLPIIALVVVFLLLGVAAAAWGTDTRSGFADDHNR
jgi:hypothetical protein